MRVEAGIVCWARMGLIFPQLNRPGLPGDIDLRWVLLPFCLLKLGLSERLNSCQRPIPRSFDDERLRS